jgi:hypothetical protein
MSQSGQTIQWDVSSHVTQHTVSIVSELVLCGKNELESHCKIEVIHEVDQQFSCSYLEAKGVWIVSESVLFLPGAVTATNFRQNMTASH